jgi:hypothetical protein
MSPTMSNIVYAEISGGASVRPYPRMSGATARYPAAASADN